MAGANRLCDVVAAGLPPGAPSPIRGVWDGFGLSLSGTRAGAAFDVDLPAGRHRLTLTAEIVPAASDATLTVRARDQPPVAVGLTPQAPSVTVTDRFTHPGGTLHIDLSASRENVEQKTSVPNIWISGIDIETDID